jgi:hypothetical protein
MLCWVLPLLALIAAVIAYLAYRMMQKGKGKPGKRA